MWSEYDRKACYEGSRKKKQYAAEKEKKIDNEASLKDFNKIKADKVLAAQVWSHFNRISIKYTKKNRYFPTILQFAYNTYIYGFYEVEYDRLFLLELF